MKKRAIAAVLAIVMLFTLAMPAFASTVTQGNAKQLVEAKIWAKNDNDVYTFEDTEDYMTVFAVNNGVTLEFHVYGIPAAPHLVNYEVTGEKTILTYVTLFNAIVIKFVSSFYDL